MALVLKPLLDLFICRICSKDFTFGIGIFECENDLNAPDLQTVINKYLPLKVQDDGKMPRCICPECHSQLSQTVDFFNKIIYGQQKLREMWQKEAVLRKSLGSKDILYLEQNNDKDPISVASEHDPSFYTSHCEIFQQVNGKPRGRPRKNALVSMVETTTVTNDTSSNSANEEDLTGPINEGGSRPRRRRRKAPARFVQLLAGKAFDQALLEEGAIDTSEAGLSADDAPAAEIIGHKKSRDGTWTRPVLLREPRQSGRRKKAENSIVCDLCGKIFKDETTYQHHKEEHQELEKQGDNIQSDQILVSASNQEEEATNTQNNGEQNNAIIKNEFESNQQAKQKKKNMGDGSDGYECQDCGRIFSHLVSLAYHRKVTHNNEEFYECSKCSKTFRHKLLLLRHQAVHSDDRPFTCKICQLSFKTKSNLSNHLITHAREKKYKCDKCGRSYNYKSLLTQHMLAHQGIKPIQCEYCGKGFTNRSSMKEHTRIHTGERPFQCATCDYKFKTSSQLKFHTKTHSDERPWQCTFCPRKFLHKLVWKTHERRHRGEKPFECNYCQRGFSERWALIKHIRLHTGEKPYSCDTCGRLFADCSNLKKHARVHNDPIGENFVHVVNQQNEDPSQMKRFFLHYKTDELYPESEGNVSTLLDGEGNPISLLLPNGISIQLLSIDADNVLTTQTSDGWSVQLQLPQGYNLEDENILEQIRQALIAIYHQDGKEEENSTLAMEGNTILDSSLMSAILLPTEVPPVTDLAGIKNVYFFPD